MIRTGILTQDEAVKLLVYALGGLQPRHMTDGQVEAVHSRLADMLTITLAEARRRGLRDGIPVRPHIRLR